MSIKSRITPAIAVLTLIGGVGVAATSNAGAATPGCGAQCVELFSQLFKPTSVLDVLHQNQTVGQPTTLAPASDSNPGEDFTSSYEGLVSDFYAAGLVSVGLYDLYANLPASEYEYSPNGIDSGLCLGVNATPHNGTPVTLQPCGVSAQTLWIADPAPKNGAYTVLINGATNSNFTHPQVLTTLLPYLPLFTFSMISLKGNVLPTQTWGTAVGVLP